VPFANSRRNPRLAASAKATTPGTCVPPTYPAAILTPRALLGVAAKVDAADVVMMALLRLAHTGEEGLRAVRAVGHLVVDALDDVTAVQIVPQATSSAIISVSRATRLRMKDKAAPSERKAIGRILPLRSRITTTHWRLSFWFLANRRSTRFSLRFAG
jgi:hypothetical protein